MLDEVEDAMDGGEDRRRDQVRIQQAVGVAQSGKRSRPAAVRQLVGDHSGVAQRCVGKLQTSLQERQEADAEAEQPDIDEAFGSAGTRKAGTGNLEREETVGVDPQPH